MYSHEVPSEQTFSYGNQLLIDGYHLSVVNINGTKTFAVTLDIHKVWYNRKIIGDGMSILLKA